MVSNQALGARIAASLVILSAPLAGCSWLHSGAHENTDAPRATAVATGASEAPVASADDITATEAAVRASPSAGVGAAAPGPAEDIIKPGAPKSYTVKRGDTLWAIASLFLKDPWLWPEVWYVNPQIENPHLIYPGDTLTLAYGANGRPQILLQRGGGDGARLDPRLRSTGTDGAIPTVPYSAIAAFLTRPAVLTREQIDKAPYIVAFRDQHEVAGSNNEVYIRNLKAAEHSRFSVIHVGAPVRDPDDGKLLGYQGIYTGTALVSSPGNPTKALLIDTARETLRGDKVLATDTEVPLNFMLRAPRTDIHGRIISIFDGTGRGTDVVGQYQVVIINRGKRHGVDAGTILAVDQRGEVVRDVYGPNRGFTGRLGTSFAPKVRLPDERAGTLLVFKAFDRMSYGLIVGASNTIHENDVVRNP